MLKFVNRIRTYHIALGLFVAFFMVACTTKKNTFVTRSYHNLTSRYNGYFYAKESMKDAKYKVERSYVDDYSQLLPLFQLPGSPETKSSYTDLEKAIKKSTTVIERHAITDRKGVEVAGAVKWIDENYLIIGQAHYYKGENAAAMEMFDYIIQKYPKFPTRYDAVMWKARTLVQMGAYSQAESQLDVIANDKNCPEKLKVHINLSYVDLYMNTGNKQNAIKYLEEALPQVKRKRDRARYTYILAQLYEFSGDIKKASSFYSKVIELNPAYEMLFNAKLARARLSGADSKGRTAARKELDKMLEDEKNKEYQDQIYYTLGQLELSAGKKEAAIGFFKKSVSVSVGNNKQKALSHLALGELYFGDQNYRNAQAYYDSTMMFLPKEYVDYNKIKDQKESLTTLIRYLNVVAQEDSLQMVVNRYGGDTTTLYAYIDNIIKKLKEQEEKEKELKEQNNGGPGMNNINQGNAINNNNQNNGALWYYYNQSAVSFGLNEFTRKWGNRKLEDNWRRNNKESMMIEPQGEDGGDTSAVVAKNKKGGNDNKSRDFYLKNLPTTPQQKATSDEKIADALYNLGAIFKEQMRNNAKSIESFEALCARYPKHKYALPSHFQLYKLYGATGNKSKEEEHKSHILTNHPNSEYANIIRNPNHEVNVLAEKDKINKYYDETYVIYQRNDYANVISRCNTADTMFGTKHEHAAKFAYLRATSLGKTSGNAVMEAELMKIIANYPKDPVKDQAQALLDALKKQRGETLGAKDSTPVDVAQLYTNIPNAEHQLMIVVETGKGNINQFKIALSDFNSQNFASSGYQISSVVLDNKRQVITVKRFTNQTKALEYYNMLKARPDIMANLLSGSYEVYPISTDNFGVFYKDKNTAPYKAFFENNILPKK
jgi:tetratricopeptide (TPR) repeat protein